MRAANLLYSGLLVFVLLCLCLGCYSHKPSARGSKERSGTAKTDTVYDDLQWLVGSWVCTKKQVHGVEDPRLNPLGPEELYRINVFYPFYYSQMTLALDRIPKRQILAEFLVRSNGRVLPMDGGVSSVRIGTDRIVVGSPAPHAVEFSYSRGFDDTEDTPILRLKSVGSLREVDLTFRKIADCPGPPESLSDLDMVGQRNNFRYYAHQYEQLKWRVLNPRRDPGNDIRAADSK